jgi:lysophospholipase L1-like esterase
MRLRDKGRWLFGKLALAAGSLAATLVLVEIAVRVIGLAPPPGLAGDPMQRVLIFDDKLETRYQAGAHTTIRSQYGEFTIDYAFNELGLRDRPLPPRSADGSYRILALGNSFVEGWGVQAEDSFARIAETSLSGRRPVRIINAGMSGYGAAQCYLMLKELLPKTGADAVIFFYLPTMLPADHKFLRKANCDGEGLATGLNVDALLNTPAPAAATTGNAFVDSPLVSGLSEYSSLARYVRARVANRIALKSIVAGDPESDLLAAYRAPPEQLAGLHAPTLRHVAAMAALARAAGVPFLVIQLPLPCEISPVEWRRGRQLYAMDPEATSFSALTQLPADFLRAQSVPLVAAHEFLASKAAQTDDATRIYFDFDFHLNVAGQRLLGEWLAGVLGEHISW